MSNATATKPEELAGQALDDALKENDLPRSGTADEKRTRLADHLAAQAPTPDEDADASTGPGDEFSQLTGDDLDEAAAAADIEGRSTMTADEKRDALRDHAAGATGQEGNPAQPTPEVNASEFPNPAVARAGSAHLDGGPVGGRVDNLTRRSDADALEGHFVKIDLKNADAAKAIEDVVGGPADDHDYGVYLEPASVDPDSGYPVTAKVRLRDETNGLVVVPYAALRASEAGHR